MALTKLNVYNRTLQKLGADTVSAVDEDTKNANIISEIYDYVLVEVLQETFWTFATKRVELTIASGISAVWESFDLNYVYELPSDYINVIGWSDNTAITKFEVIGSTQYILSDISGLGMLYVFNNIDQTQWSPLFYDAFTDKLAAECAFMVLNSATKTAQMTEKYETISLPKAKAKEAQMNTPNSVNQNQWVNAKYSNSTTYSRYPTRYR